MRFRMLFSLALVIIALGCAGTQGNTAALPSPTLSSAGDEGDSEQWYFWTDDRVQHFAYDLGRARGAGDTVIVLHGGWGAEHSYLVRPLAPLGDKFRLVFYDQRGSLRSPAPDSTVRLPRLVSDLEHLRRSLGLEQVTLIAHSMGAQLAYAYLAEHPQRVRGLVLIGATQPSRWTSGPNMSYIRQVWPEADSTDIAARTQSFFREYGERALREIAREGLLPDSLRGVPWDSLDLMSAHRDRERTRVWRITFAAVNSCNPERWREMEGGMVYYSQRAANNILNDTTYARLTERFFPALRQFSGPVRVIMGTCDYVDPGPTVWPHAVRRLRDGRLTVIEDSGHSIWMDQPGEFVRAVREALAATTKRDN
jgi:proline iminopeptidase